MLSREAASWGQALTLIRALAYLAPDAWQHPEPQQPHNELLGFAVRPF